VIFAGFCLPSGLEPLIILPGSQKNVNSGFTSMKVHLTTLHVGRGTSTMIEPGSGRKPVSALPIRRSDWRQRVMRLLLAIFLVMPVFGARAGVVFTTIYSFTNGNDGPTYPLTALVQGSDGYLYGTTSGGFGTVFQISTNGVLTILYAFNGGNDGAGSSGLVQGSDGDFYGTTSDGGTNNVGTVFQLSTNGGLTSWHSFTGIDGEYPSAALVQGSDGDFYGTTSGGGVHANQFGQGGTVFQINTNRVFASLYSFTGGDDGYDPSGLVPGSDHSFYGTTTYGGSHTNQFGGTYGTVFKISTNGQLTTLYAFGTVTNANGEPLDGANPQGGLVQGSDGDFYGTTSAGGTNNVGTVFQLSTNGGLTSLHSFTGIDGEQPSAALVQGSDGNFYGTTFGGGTNQDGAVFKISTNGQFTTLYAFGTVTNANGEPLDGANPQGGLVQGSDGSFYGTTTYGGVGGGTVFRLTIVPEFQAVTLTNSTLSLTWSTEAGGVYQLQYNSDLSSTNWINLNGPAKATGATLSTTDSLTNGPQRFYRLALSP
jgi:uncharacterized repeat protein (TIGR03803 family)